MQLKPTFVGAVNALASWYLEQERLVESANMFQRLALIDKRNAARKNKDFATADGVRDQLGAAGIKIEDGPDGTTWRRDD